MSSAGTPVTDEAYVGLAGSGTAAAGLGCVLKGYDSSAFSLC